MENTTEHTKYTRFMLFILAIVLLVASIVGYIVSRKINSGLSATTTNYALSPTSFPIPTPSLIPYPTKGSLILKSQTAAPIKVGSPFIIDVFATSGEEVVAGYDIVFSYDTASMTGQTIKNKLPSFKTYTFKRPDHLSISATKDLSFTDPVKFANTPLVSFTLIAQKKGTYSFSLKPVGNESSKFVNEAAAVTYPETADIRLEIN